MTEVCNFCIRQFRNGARRMWGKPVDLRSGSLQPREACRPPINVHHRHSGKRISAELTVAAILISALFTGCVTPPDARTDLLAFLETGQTTREEVLLKLGQPSGSFEQERIFTYRIGQYGEQGYYIISPKVVLPAQGATWQNVHFSLVLVFDEQGRLRKHQLIRVD